MDAPAPPTRPADAMEVALAADEEEDAVRRARGARAPLLSAKRQRMLSTPSPRAQPPAVPTPPTTGTPAVSRQTSLARSRRVSGVSDTQATVLSVGSDGRRAAQPVTSASTGEESLE